MEHIRNFVKSAALLTCGVAASTAGAFTADVPHQVSDQAGGFIGLAVGSTPDYEGSDDNETTVAPFGY